MLQAFLFLEGKNSCRAKTQHFASLQIFGISPDSSIQYPQIFGVEKWGRGVAVFRIFVFQFQHAARANRSAHAAAHASRPDNGFSLLGILFYVDSHFAISRAIAAGNALSAVGGDPEAGKMFLQQTQVSGHRAAKPAPDPGTENRVKSHANYARKNEHR